MFVDNTAVFNQTIFTNYFAHCLLIIIRHSHLVEKHRQQLHIRLFAIKPMYRFIQNVVDYCFAAICTAELHDEMLFLAKIMMRQNLVS